MTTPWRFIVWWCVLLCLHCVCIGYYVGFARVYRYLVNTTVGFELRTNSIAIAESDYVKVAIVHEVVAAIHACFVLLMVGGSLRERRLVFSPEVHLQNMKRKLTTRIKVAPKHTETTSVVPTEATSSRRRSSSITIASQLVLETSGRVGRALFSRRGLLGVDFEYFDHFLLARELVEVSLQTYQAYRMTRLLPRLWLVRVYVALLVANCWVVPILHRVYVRRHRLRRMMALLCDVVLDIVSSMGISLIIFCSYLPQYTDPRFGFPFNNWYNDEWFVGVVQEFQIMMVVSWGDMASRLVFASGVLQAMDSLKEMLMDSLVEQATSSRKTDSNKDTDSAHSMSTCAPWLGELGGSGAFVIWGGVILVVHIYAEAQRIDLPCRLPLRPWLSGKPACSLVEIDCYERNASGASGTMGEAWTVFDPTLTAGLVIRHCPELTIPPSMVLYTGITSMKVYNATISSWSSECGLTSASHGRLRSIYLIRTNFTDGEMPRGLLRSDFPQTFRSFFLSKTNLASIPTHVDQLWPKGLAISIEHASFTSIPDVIMRLSPGLISFSRCPIARVPANLFEIPTLRDLFLSNTAIQELPRDVPKPAGLNSLFIGGTNVSVLWPWVDWLVEHSLFLQTRLLNAYGTPFCEELQQISSGTRKQFSAAAGLSTTTVSSLMDVSTPSRLARTNATVTCVPDFGTFFPLAMQDEISAIPDVEETMQL